MCGYDLNLTYPQNGTFPTLDIIFPTSDSETSLYLAHVPSLDTPQSKSWKAHIAEKYYAKAAELDKRELRFERREERRQQWKRDLTGRANGTIDPWYGCFLLLELQDYAANFSFPWSKSHMECSDSWSV